MPGRALLGRTAELGWLLSLASAAHAGRSSTHIVEGDPGIGKTALLQEATQQVASQVRVMAIAGVQAEVDLPFAALQRIVLAHRDTAEEIPDQHRSALLVASGLEDGVTGDRLSIGMALLLLLSRLSGKCGLFVWVDDSQWIDPDSLAAIAFVVRRIQSDRMAVVLTRRPVDDGDTLLAGLPVRHLPGLDVTAASELFARTVGRTVDHSVAERVSRATGGNPLALIDLGAELTYRQVEGTSPLPDPVPPGTHLQQHYARQIVGLPPDTRRWLLLAAAEPDGDFALVCAAGEDAALPPPASSAAEQVHLVTITDRVTFRHPLIRAAVYGAATHDERRTAHHHLGRVTHTHGATTRSLIHRAAASAGLDADLADQLEAAANTPAVSTNATTRTQLLIRSANASPPTQRAARLLLAAEAAWRSGSQTQAVGLLAQIDAASLDAPGRLTLELVGDDLRISTLADDAFAGRAAAFLRVSELLQADGRHSAALVRGTMAISAAWQSASRTKAMDDTAIAHSLRRIPRSNHPRPIELSVRAFAELAVGDTQCGVESYRAAVAAFTDTVIPDQEHLVGFAGVVHAAGLLLDDGSRDLVLAAMEETARENGAKNLLCSIISLRCQFDVQAGRIAVARARYHEMQEMMDLVGYPLDYPPLVAMGAAIRGWTANPPIDSADFIRGVAACERTGYGAGVEQWLRAWVANRIAAGEYTEAWTVARDIDIDTGAADGFLLADLIEIASRTGQPSRAQMLQNALATRGARMPTSTFAGLLCWADAFTGDDTDTAFRSAIHHFENANATLFTARAHLGLGEWLRRQRRRRQALTHLGTAAAIFADQGVAGWAARAERELAALGIAHQPTRSQYFDLTPQEATVARLAGEGATNGEIAERLYISPSTVDYHLRKVYRKFGVTSRRQLRTTLA